MTGSKTRLFFVVDSIEDNEEIFATLEKAKKFMKALSNKDKPRLYIAIVKNYFFDKANKSWNYEDLSDTFEIVKQLN